MSLAFFFLTLYLICLIFQPQRFYPWLIPLRPAFVSAGLSLASGLLLKSRLLASSFWCSKRNLLLVFFFLITGASWLTVEGPGAEKCLEILLVLLKVVLLYFAIILSVNGERQILGLVRLTIILFAINGMVSIYMYHLGRLGYRMDSYFGGMASDTNEFSLIMVMLIPITIALFRTSKSLLWRIFLSLSFLTFLYCISRSMSRGGFLGLLIVFACLLIQYRKSKGIVIGILILAVFLFYKTPFSYWNRMKTIVNPEASGDTADQARIRLKKESLFLISKYPILGTGIGNFRAALWKHGYEEQYGDSHDSFLGVASETGILNGIIFISIIIITFKELLVSGRKMRERRLPALETLSKSLMVSLLGYTICSLFLSMQYNRLLYIVLALSNCLRMEVLSKGDPDGKI